MNHFFLPSRAGAVMGFAALNPSYGAFRAGGESARVGCAARTDLVPTLQRGNPALDAPASNAHKVRAARPTALVLTLLAIVTLLLPGLAAHADDLRGTGDLGLIVERAKGSIQLIDTTKRARLQRVEGLGDTSHASAVFSRDARFAYVFGRDGGLTKVDLLSAKIVKRVIQSGNAIGGAISQDGRTLAVANYTPGGVRLFDSETLELLADIPAQTEAGLSRVVGLEDSFANRFVFSLFDAGETWLMDLGADRTQPKISKFKNTGRQPYDALITGDGRWYVAGLYGEDGLAVLDLWHPERGVKRVLPDYGRGEQKLPVYKMPHLETWAVAGGFAFIPGVGRHEVVLVDINTWEKVGVIPVAGQPVFVMSEPTGRRLWVNFAFPNYDTVQVIDVESRSVIHTMKPGKAVLHMEFTPRGEAVWLSVRDANRVDIFDVETFAKLGELAADAPSGIFFSARAHRFGL